MALYPLRRRALTAAAVAVTLVVSAGETSTWAGLCSPDDTPDAELRRAALFSQFKENYFISGWPQGPTKTDPSHYVRFQLSIKFNLLPTRSRCTLLFTFTQKSFWKLWTTSPAFEDSNYNPAFFLAWRDHDYTSQVPGALQGARLLNVLAGYEHESNGLGETASRGWDRLSVSLRAGYFFDDGFLGGGWHVVVQPKGWVPFVPRDAPQDLVDYLGYGQLSVEIARQAADVPPGQPSDGPRYVYKDIVLGAMGRPGKAFDRGYFEAWARVRLLHFPIISWSVFALFSTGYGETLARYNERLPPTVRVGIALDDRVTADPPRPQ